MKDLVRIILIGCGATAMIDLWALVRRPLLRRSAA